MAIEIGQQAPDFTLSDTDKNQVTLSNEQGKNILLLFFPFAFTSVCTAELCSVRDNIQQYNDLNAQVYGISVDSPYTLKRFREEQRLNFPLLSDFNKEASAAYGVLEESFGNLGLKGVSKRAAFLIDREGVIQYAEVLQNAGLQPDFEAINKALSSLSPTV